MPHTRHWLLNIALNAYPERREQLEGLVPSPVLAEAWLQVARKAGVDRWKLARSVAAAFSLETIDPREVLSTSARLLPERLVRQHVVLPIKDSPEGLVIALANPGDTETLAQVRFAYPRSLVLRVAPPEDLEDAINALYAASMVRDSGRFGVLRWRADGTPIDPNPGDDSHIAELGRRIVQEAIRRGASDVHMQPFTGGALVRIRVDGVLQRLLTLPLNVYETYLRRIKTISRMDTTKDLIPQDGRLSLEYGNQRYDLRVSTLPSSGIERLVFRILDQSKIYSVTHLSFAQAEKLALQRIAGNTAGLFLLTGPTGCGKTTTLYSMLSGLNRVDTNIITVEEPVEYRLNGISQVDIDPRSGLTFASAIRSILRQDPDILLVGEIRDAETADIAVKAALTGHLVFSTLHTMDALTTIPRLLDLGIRPSFIADTLLGAMAQRLLRRLCPQCKTRVTEPLATMEQFFQTAMQVPPAYRAIGCESCQNTGYQGRLPVAEIVEVNEALRAALLDGRVDMDSLRAATTGSRSLESSAAAWIVSGETTPEEAFRVLGQRFWNRLHEAGGGTSVAGRVFASPFREGQEELDRPGILFYQEEGWGFEVFEPWVARAGYALFPAQTTDECKTLLQTQANIGLLLLDLSTLGQKFRSLLQQLYQTLAGTGLPAILIVDENHTELIAVLKDFGVTDYLTAPVTRENLLARIEEKLRRAS
ncbi:MAG: hypothetical protein QG599_2848 [Pseudomonadota bacterium]|nr:hypothetical protein [Pseudomonadota bacterium]